MKTIILWILWGTVFTAEPDPGAFDRLCRETHPEGRLSVSDENIIWRGKVFPAWMLICAREEPAKQAEPNTLSVPGPTKPIT